MSTTQPPSTPGAQEHKPVLTLEQARRVIWQTKPKEPMGKLLDAGLIGRKDLEWARLKAYRPEVRSAARVLLAALDAPPAPPEDAPPPAPAAPEPLRYGPRVIAASAYLEDRQETSIALAM